MVGRFHPKVAGVAEFRGGGSAGLVEFAVGGVGEGGGHVLRGVVDGAGAAKVVVQVVGRGARGGIRAEDIGEDPALGVLGVVHIAAGVSAKNIFLADDVPVLVPVEPAREQAGARFTKFLVPSIGKGGGHFPGEV